MLAGRRGCGKTALAAHVALESGYPYVRLVSPEKLVGLSEAAKVAELMDRIAPRRIVYVSCHPGTLARDAAVLVHDKRFSCEAAGIIDMFPHTAHVESIAVFSK